MQSQAARLMYALAISIAVAALVPAVAIAGRWGPGTPSRASEQPGAVDMPLGTCHQYCGSVSERHGGPTAPALRPRIVTVVARSGFSWSDAAIGFGTACGLALVTAGALAYRRHGAVHEIREPA